MTKLEFLIREKEMLEHLIDSHTMSLKILNEKFDVVNDLIKEIAGKDNSSQTPQ